MYAAMLHNPIQHIDVQLEPQWQNTDDTTSLDNIFARASTSLILILTLYIILYCINLILYCTCKFLET